MKMNYELHFYIIMFIDKDEFMLWRGMPAWVCVSSLTSNST